MIHHYNKDGRSSFHAPECDTLEQNRGWFRLEYIAEVLGL